MKTFRKPEREDLQEALKKVLIWAPKGKEADYVLKINLRNGNFFIGSSVNIYGDDISFISKKKLKVVPFIELEPSVPFQRVKDRFLFGKSLTIKNIKKECKSGMWRYVWIRGGTQTYNAALRLDGRDIVIDSGKGGQALQLIGVDAIEFTDRWESSDIVF